MCVTSTRLVELRVEAADLEVWHGRSASDEQVLVGELGVQLFRGIGDLLVAHVTRRLPLCNSRSLRDKCGGARTAGFGSVSVTLLRDATIALRARACMVSITTAGVSARLAPRRVTRVRPTTVRRSIVTAALVARPRHPRSRARVTRASRARQSRLPTRRHNVTVAAAVVSITTAGVSARLAPRRVTRVRPTTVRRSIVTAALVACVVAARDVAIEARL